MELWELISLLSIAAILWSSEEVSSHIDCGLHTSHPPTPKKKTRSQSQITKTPKRPSSSVMTSRVLQSSRFCLPPLAVGGNYTGVVGIFRALFPVCARACTFLPAEDAVGSLALLLRPRLDGQPVRILWRACHGATRGVSSRENKKKTTQKNKNKAKMQ